MSPARPLELFISRERIAEAVHRLAREIEAQYPGDMPLFVGVLKGSFIFLADLVREIERPVEMDFLRLSSYSGTSSTGLVRPRSGVTSPVRARDVLVVEDIVDTGLTTTYTKGYFRRRSAASVKLCTLLDKPARRRVEIAPDFVGFTIANEFVVGYGLDMDEKYRHLADIHIISGEDNGP